MIVHTELRYTQTYNVNEVYQREMDSFMCIHQTKYKQISSLLDNYARYLFTHQCIQLENAQHSQRQKTTTTATWSTYELEKWESKKKCRRRTRCIYLQRNSCTRVGYKDCKYRVHRYRNNNHHTTNIAQHHNPPPASQYWKQSKESNRGAEMPNRAFWATW